MSVVILFAVTIHFARADLLRDRRTPGPSILWTYTAASGAFNNPAVSHDGKALFIQNDNDSICKLNASTGHQMWCVPLSSRQSDYFRISTTDMPSADGTGNSVLLIQNASITEDTVAVDGETGSILTSMSASIVDFAACVPDPKSQTFACINQNTGVYGLSPSLEQKWLVLPTPYYVTNDLYSHQFDSDGDQRLFVAFVAYIGGYNISTGDVVIPEINTTSSLAGDVWYVAPDLLMVSGTQFGSYSFAAYDISSAAGGNLQLWNTSVVPYWENALIKQGVAGGPLRPRMFFAFLVNQGINASLIAIDVTTGDVVWQVPEATNMTLVEGSVRLVMDSSASTLFLLTQAHEDTANTRLRTYDAETGTLRGELSLPLIGLYDVTAFAVSPRSPPGVVYIVMNWNVYAIAAT